jgi:alpha-glucosidase
MKGGCPFKVRSYLLSSECWRLNVVNNKHNHEMTQNFQVHKYAERLRPDEKDLVLELTESMAAPRNIMSTLKKSWETMARYNLKKSNQGLRRKMRHQMKCLVEGKYLYTHIVLSDTKTLSNILWVHPNSVKLFNTFSTVLIIDSTYKSNKYWLPLLQYICSTSTGKTYVVAFAFWHQRMKTTLFIHCKASTIYCDARRMWRSLSPIVTQLLWRQSALFSPNVLSYCAGTTFRWTSRQIY